MTEYVVCNGAVPVALELKHFSLYITEVNGVDLVVQTANEYGALGGSLSTGSKVAVGHL